MMKIATLSALMVFAGISAFAAGDGPCQPYYKTCHDDQGLKMGTGLGKCMFKAAKSQKDKACLSKMKETMKAMKSEEESSDRAAVPAEGTKQ